MVPASLDALPICSGPAEGPAPESDDPGPGQGRASVANAAGPADDPGRPLPVRARIRTRPGMVPARPGADAWHLA